MSWIRSKVLPEASNQTMVDPTSFGVIEQTESRDLHQFGDVPALNSDDSELSGGSDCRNLLPTMTLGLVLGVLLPLVLFLPLYHGTSSQAAETQSPRIVAARNGIHVTVSQHQAANLTVDAKALAASQEQAAKAQLDTSAPSNVADFVINQEVTLSPREFLYVKGGQRLYQPEVTFEPVDGKGAAVKISAEELKILPGDTGRMKAKRSDAEWQASWSFNNAERNIKLGSEYVQYLDKAFGDSFGNKLTAVNRGQSDILSKVGRTTAAPTGGTK